MDLLQGIFALQPFFFSEGPAYMSDLPDAISVLAPNFIGCHPSLLFRGLGCCNRLETSGSCPPPLKFLIQLSTTAFNRLSSWILVRR